MIADISPGLILILGALLAPVLRGHLRSVWVLALPMFALLHLASLPTGEAGAVQLMGLSLTTLRVDGLSRVFGYAFLVAILFGLIYSLHLRDPVQQVAALIHAGSALGAVFAGDLVTLFFFWAGMAISSVFLIWASRSEAATRAGMRYLIFQVVGGLLLLEGVLHFHHDYGTIAFGELSLTSIAGWMVLGAFGIMAAFPILHMWLVDAYSRATPTGAVILSAFTTKVAVYALARAFPGLEMLIPIGAVMVVLPLILAAIADDLRQVIAYVLISQIGVMVIGVGIGSELALNGVAAQAFAHILTMLLLFMAAGAVVYRTGTAAASALGGLHRSMPWTAAFALLAALSLAAPLFGGFVGNGLIISAAAFEGHVWAWLVLVIGVAGAFALVVLKVVYFAFFGPREVVREADAPANMHFAMGLAVALSLAIGMFPGFVFALLPHAVTFDPYRLDHVVAQLQLLAFAGLAVLLMRRFRLLGEPEPGIALDLDWLYRRPVRSAALAGLAGARRARATVLGIGWRGLSHLSDRIYHYMGPGGIMARNWPTGAMAFWTTVLLAVWLLAYFV